ncbi:hypothetical protein JOL79_04120 [Microbispora sp. RL4-1S]|uniref:Uncharacterized protein n=1 Tax=Microbispora oryzae TaxID=2806554 RepID=A0A941AIB7_9ACTN|nr:hypothetical protein [Microbispora oryzae]MBP2702988.1 hypothetical protein [Microbispora oryzae]
MRGFPVEHSVRLESDPATVWLMLVEAGRAQAWWGRLERDITHVAQELSVSTGSSSLYRVWIESITPGEALEFTSAYLGVSPVSSVRFDLSGAGPVRLCVTETVDSADPATIYQVRRLWQHRFDRLAAALPAMSATDGVSDIAELGARGGPGPIPDISVRRTLDRPGWRPLHRAVLSEWLPLSGPAWPPRWFYVVDSEGPRPFPIVRWHTHFDDLITLGIEAVRGSPPTEAEVAVTAHSASLELQVRHTGWSALDLDAETREVLRDRFLATWQHTLQRAAQV